MLLTPEQITTLILGVWNQRYTDKKLPLWLLNTTATAFEKAATDGWGGELGTTVKSEVELELLLKKNVFYFAAHKNAQELKALQELYNKFRKRDEFVVQAAKLDKTWNVNWFATEQTTTTRLAKSGREWLRTEEVAKDFPLLKFIAVNDLNTRPEHAMLNGIVRPVNDSFWLKYTPPLSWNCRCRYERLEEGTVSNLEKVKMPKVEKQFQERVTESKKIWNENHPYFKGLSKEATKQIDLFVNNRMNEK